MKAPVLLSSWGRVGGFRVCLGGLRSQYYWQAGWKKKKQKPWTAPTFLAPAAGRMTRGNRETD